jgi:hypothetical protein
MATCDGEIWNGWGFKKCGKPTQMQHEGKHYCGIHDPVMRAAKREERYQARKAKWAAQDAAKERRELEEAYCAGLTNDELKRGRIVAAQEAE